MTKPPRNPRRAYDEHGNEIPPATVASTRKLGLITVSAFCETCGHHAAVPLDGWPEDLPAPDMALRLRCSECGSRDIKIMLNVAEYYTLVPGTEH